MIASTHPPENLVVYEVKGGFNETGRPDLGEYFLGFWVESDYTFFFFSHPADGSIKSLLDRLPDLTLRHVHHMKYADWQDGAGFTPFSVGPLTVVPAWGDPIDPAPDIPIRIDPGLAFGFGGHPTTRACLGFLVRIYQEDTPQTVLDLGTGTGILAVAAAKLGAQNILAVENSHLAAETAAKNVTLNELENKIHVVQGLAEDHARTPADLVVSNLHMPVQEAVLAQGGFDQRRYIILSGLFHSQAETMADHLEQKGYRLMDLIRDERWVSSLWQGADG
jgi:ribosomal protein L11 methyltransferase